MTATNVYVNVFKELENRLTTAMDSGKLTELKTIVMGQRTFAKGPVEKPSLTGSTGDPFVEEEYTGTEQYTKSAFLNIKLQLLYAIADKNVDNLYYNSADPPVGIIPLIEEILDVLCETTGQALDPQFAQNSRKSIDIKVGTIEKLSDNSLKCDIELQFNINNFRINGRYSTP